MAEKKKHHHHHSRPREVNRRGGGWVAPLGPGYYGSLPQQPLSAAQFLGAPDASAVAPAAAAAAPA